MASRQPARSSGADREVGNFRVGSEIGRGSFAVVYKGHHLKKNGTLAAIKMVQRQKLSKKLLENLESEIQILKKLNHPHIVALWDCQKTEKHIHIIMEYCPVGDLSTIIKKRDRLNTLHPCLEPLVRDYPSPPGGGLHEVVVRHFLKQLTSALQYLRESGLVHRDVKPQNLLLDPPPGWTTTTSDEGNRMESSRMLVGLETLPVLKLADFGFARVLPAASMAETLCGSPLYMAPEILHYEKYDASADLWSVGTVIYEMSTGRPPFRATNHMDLLHKIDARKDRIDFPSACAVSDELRTLIRSLLKRSPIARLKFEDLFVDPIITGEIPGAMVPKPVEEHFEETHQPEPEPVIRSRSSSFKSATDQRARGVERETKPMSSSPKPSHMEESSLPFATGSPVPTLPRLTDLHRNTTQAVPTMRSPTRDVAPPIRPAFNPSVTAPQGRDMILKRSPSARDMVAIGRSPSGRGLPLSERQSSRGSNASPGGSLLKEQRRSARSGELRGSESDEYVIVDKKQVVVNAFADELATARRGGHTPPIAAQNALVRRTSSSKNQAQRPVSVREPALSKGSFERRFGSSPGSAKSALAKALELASGRLFGTNISPPNQSPPKMQGPFANLPNPNNMVVMGNTAIAEEDLKTLGIIEETANKADVVYNFAEVKFAQLMPVDGPAHGLGLLSAGEGTSGSSSCDMTADAVVQTAEEALVLFVKSLELLSRAMDMAKTWWSVNNARNEPQAPARVAAAARMNSVVQWVRERFNEVLDKADIVKNKLSEAQKELPPSHPAHPNNHPMSSDLSVGSSATSAAMVTLGTTAEKLMYDRALEMSRAAAVNELVGDDFRQCEAAYITSIRLLGAVLELDSTDSEEKIDDDDRALIEKLLRCVDDRLSQLRKKMETLSRRSPVQSAQGSPYFTHPPSPLRGSPVPSLRGQPGIITS